MVTRFNSYVDAVSVFDRLEIGLISFSSNPIRVHDDDDLSGLMSSIRQHGLLEPIIVRPKGKRFEVVAGNRRLRACKLLRYRRVRCIITGLNDAEAYEVSLIENVQRRTLNPLEEAAAFKKYCDKFGWGSQTELAKKLGKSQEYVSHRLKLLELPAEAKEDLRAGRLSPTSAQEMVWLKSGDSRLAALEMVKGSKLNTRSVRRLVRDLNSSELARPKAEFETPTEEVETDHTQSFLEEAILIMRISIARLDWIVTKVQDTRLREVLLSKRAEINRMVDELIQLKMSDLGLSHQIAALVP
jgi:ParB family chromosome partitioning protein